MKSKRENKLLFYCELHIISRNELAVLLYIILSYANHTMCETRQLIAEKKKNTIESVMVDTLIGMVGIFSILIYRNCPGPRSQL